MNQKLGETHNNFYCQCQSIFYITISPHLLLVAVFKIDFQFKREEALTADQE